MMGKIYDRIDDQLSDWIQRQQMFFVATAPLSDSGLVNCSPKGGDSFRILNGSEVAYQDLTGSGVETIAHLRENGRIVIMFCAFEGSPKIVRLHGTGTVLTEGDNQYSILLGKFPPHIGTRSIIHITVSRISDSCGYSVPLYEFMEPRDVLDKWSAHKGKDQLREYRNLKNSQSIDGLPGLDIDVEWEIRSILSLALNLLKYMHVPEADWIGAGTVIAFRQNCLDFDIEPLAMRAALDFIAFQPRCDLTVSSFPRAGEIRPFLGLDVF